MTTLKITKKMLNDIIRKFTVYSSEYSIIRNNSWVDIYADCETEDDYVTLGHIANELYYVEESTVERYVLKGTDTSETLLFDETLSEDGVVKKEGIDYADPCDYRDAVDAVIAEKYEKVDVYEDDVIAWVGECNVLYVGDRLWDFEKALVKDEIEEFLRDLEHFKINDVEYKVGEVRDIDGGFEIYFTIECRRG
ncbi:hypothetical protein Mpsy_0648 [Methanolobus psychrophilus R15]|nr:hypothetical protein Mpsy_0648 [Methanolobus psychrophilus R15]